MRGNVGAYLNNACANTAPHGLSAGKPSAWKLRGTHQKLVDSPCALPAFADCPHDETLTAPHIAGGEHFRSTGRVSTRSGLRLFSGRTGIAADILLDAEIVEHRGHRRNKSHREQHKVGRDLELRSRDFNHFHRARQRILLPFDTCRDQGLDVALAVAFEALRRDRPGALEALLVA